MRRKLLAVATVSLVAAAIGVAVWAISQQHDTTTGRVTVSDFIALSPTADWLVIPGGESASGEQPLTLSNNNDFPVTLTPLTVTHSDAQFLGTLTLTMTLDADPTTCSGGTATQSELLDVQDEAITLFTTGVTVAAQASRVICGQLAYDQSLNVAAVDDLTFDFTATK